MITFTIVAVFIIGYACIALESGLKVNKAATALLMCVCCWILYMLGCTDFVTAFYAKDFSEFMSSLHGVSINDAASRFVGENILLSHLGDTCEILFFLMGAMAIVEVVDANGGFNFVRDRLMTKSKRSLLWRIVLITFFLSSVLDNLTTSIVMVMVLRKLVEERKDRMIYASLIILAANAGGAFSPIGDVTTIMLWIKGNISSVGIIKEVFLPAIASIIVPAFILQYKLKGTVTSTGIQIKQRISHLTKNERIAVFIIGVGGLIFVPIFRSLTGLPPFMGILLILGLLWVVTEVFMRFSKENISETAEDRVTRLLTRIDLSTILFFLGILMTVAALQEIGVLSSFGAWLEKVSSGNAYLVTGVIGMASSIIDNVPLVAGCMGMYEIAPAGTIDPSLINFVQDGTFWQLLAYCAGVGGSMLIIGSAAGVVVMGLEKISFGWYLKHITLAAFIGYIAGIFIYWLEKMFIFTV